MAAGEGGFSTQINGFNKNEVTEYIGKISKEKLTLQTELKEAESKMNAAEKRAEEAEKKAETIKAESDKQIADMSAQVKEERRKSEEYINQIDNLKRKLKNGGGAGTIKESDEIINEAKRKAQQIIDDAKRNAAGMSAGGASASAVDTSALMAALKGLQNTINTEMQRFSTRANQILSASTASDSTSMNDGFFAGMDDNADDGLASAAAGFGITEDAVTEVQPLADPELPKNEIVDSFDNELLAQTVPDASVSMEDMFNSAADKDVEADIKNDEPVGFDMGGDSAQSDLDAMNALLGQMSASLEGMGGGSMEMGAEPASEPEPAPAVDDNPWANLQAQLDAMEKSGDFGSDDSGNDAQPEVTSDAQAAPSADDLDIWNFGMDMDAGVGSSDDDGMSGDMSDDMSADLFGGF